MKFFSGEVPFGTILAMKFHLPAGTKELRAVKNKKINEKGGNYHEQIYSKFLP